MRTGLDLLLAAATSEKEVVAVVRAYLASWPADEYKRIPDEFHPTRLQLGSHLSAAAHLLAIQRLSSLEDPCLERLAELEQVYAHAAARIAMLHLYARKRISIPVSLAPRP